MSTPEQPSGLLIVAKPGGMTSHDVVARARRLLGTRKVGHAGTLDPMATGVLVLGVGRATKLLGHLALERKTYLATIALGATTSTDDADGEVLSTMDSTGVGESAVRAEIACLTGEIQQVPSSVSAIKVAGKRAYALARAGESVELPARPVTVYRFELLDMRIGAGCAGPDEQACGQLTDLDVLVECSSGTYVRALARDLGAALGVGGHLTALRRTVVGPFDLSMASTLDELAELPDDVPATRKLSLSLDDAVATAFARREVSAADARALGHGQRLPAVGIPGNYGVFDPGGHVVALVTERGDVAKPVVVLAPAR